MNRREKIIELMKKNNIKNQTQLIEEIKNKLNESFDKNTMSNIMNPEKNISNQTIQILSQFFGVPLDYFKVDSWEESSVENKKIKELLKLNESTINTIKRIDNQMEYFNSFISNFSDIGDFLENYKYYSTIKNVIALLDDFKLFFELEELILEAQKNNKTAILDKIFKYYYSILEKIEELNNQITILDLEKSRKQYDNDEDFNDYYESIDKFFDTTDLINTYNTYENRIMESLSPSDEWYAEIKDVRESFELLYKHMKRELKFYKYNLSDSFSVSLEKIKFPTASVTAKEFKEEYKKLTKQKNENKNKNTNKSIKKNNNKKQE